MLKFDLYKLFRNMFPVYDVFLSHSDEMNAILSNNTSHFYVRYLKLAQVMWSSANTIDCHLVYTIYQMQG